ncbi:MAG TPA: RND transporter [Betaproteobacteria bacterium]|nr:RND transporter [Betaproteobacteria bacterium]
MLLKLSPILALLLAFSGTAVAAAEQPTTPAEQAKLASAESSLPLIDGEVKKVDKDAGKLTIKHGPITNLGMPAMTMVFRVKDAAMLDQVKSGDAIRFSADTVRGTLTVMRLERVGATAGNTQAN